MTMRPLKQVSFVVCILGAVAFVTGHSHDPRMSPIGNAAMISAFYDRFDHVAWLPPETAFRLLNVPKENPRPRTADDTDDSIARPAWGMFAATMAVCLWLWTNTEHAFPAVTYAFWALIRPLS
jgi:hypothetical protein